MYAAVVESFDAPPRYAQIAEPSATGEHERLVDVLAAGLHQRVRSQADGSHYTSTGTLPFVPGVDGVGRDSDGTLHYFLLPEGAEYGSLAERTVIDVRRSIVLPTGSDPIAVAAAANPAMSSWVALHRRMVFRPGMDVLVLGATGNSGRFAVQIARHLGADRVIAAGRDPGRLAGLTALGATATVRLDEHGPTNVAAVAADVDVVVDYLWGEATAATMTSLVTARPDRGRPLTWIEIGAVTGGTAAIPSAALRSADLTIVGSGQGSVGREGMLADLATLTRHLSAGTFSIAARPVPLADVTSVWTQRPDAAERVVLVL